MRVGLVVPGFSADATDWCIPALRHLARALAATDDVRVIAVRYPYRSDDYAIEGARVISIGGAERRGPATLDIWRDVFRVLRREHNRRPFDVLHAFWATESGLLAAMAGRFLGVPTIVSLAGGELVALRDIGYGDQRIAWERFKVGASLRLASAVTAGSRTLTDLARRHVPPDRLHLAPLGVDTELFHPVAAPDKGGRLLHVATLTPVKDQATLLRAFAALARGRDVTLEIVGDGPLRSTLQGIASDLGIADAVHFRGAVDHADLPGVYLGASAFALSSRHEAQGMVALEAAACGVPVAGACVGVLPELTSAVAPIGEPAALLNAISSVLDAGPAAAHETFQRVADEFGLQPCTDRFRRLYANLALTGPPPRG